MIPINKLRVGNLTHRPDLVSRELRVEKILYLGQRVTCTGPVKVICDYEDLEPVLITVAWLYKFGFSEGFDWEEGNFTNSLDSSILLHFDKYKNIWVVGKYLYSGFAGSFTKLTEIKYIHQLQNIYFTLTDKELTLSVT